MLWLCLLGVSEEMGLKVTLKSADGIWGARTRTCGILGCGGSGSVFNVMGSWGKDFFSLG